MLTGRYPATTQVHSNGNAFFPDSEKLVTRILADEGYDCGLIGKLHLAGTINTNGRDFDASHGTMYFDDR